MAERISISVDPRIKRRLKDLSADKKRTMNDLIEEAIKDYLDRLDANHSAPDIVLERMSQLLMSQMNLIQSQTVLLQGMNQIKEELEELKTKGGVTSSWT